jgi:hypothetical protein
MAVPATGAKLVARTLPDGTNVDLPPVRLHLLCYLLLQNVPEDMHQRVAEVRVPGHLRQAGIVVVEHPGLKLHLVHRDPYQPWAT